MAKQQLSRTEPINLILRGWPFSEYVKDVCFSSLTKYKQDSQEIDNDIALTILISEHFNDESVINYIVMELKNTRYSYFTGKHDLWKLIILNFRDNKTIVDAIDSWIVRQTYHEPEISFAALVGRTYIVKDKLLKDLQETSLPFWIVDALLEGWGMNDLEVSSALISFASESIVKASKIASYLPSIIFNKEDCRNRLLQILVHPECTRYDFVLAGIRKLGSLPDDLLETLLQMIDKNDDSVLSSFVFQEYPLDLRVRTLAINELFKRNGNFEVLAEMYVNDTEIKSGILELISPLPARLRRIIAKKFSEHNIEDDRIINLISHYDLETDMEAKTEASIGYHNQLKIFGKEQKTALDILSKNIVCYGFDYEERRHAAFTGLLTLKRLDLMNSAEERIGDEKSASISIIASRRFGGENSDFV